MASLATPADMILRYDSRSLGDIVSDTGNRVPETSLATDPKMLKSLEAATGQFYAAILRAKRYTRLEIEALTGESKEYLKDIVCALAFWWLWRRKPYTEMNDRLRTGAEEDAKEALTMLRNGDEVFEIATSIDAGVGTVDTPSIVAIDVGWGLVVDRCRRGNFYPARREATGI